MTLGLETDSVEAGVRGRMACYLYDAGHHEILRAEMKLDIGIPGKQPGLARIADFPMAITVPRELAARTSAVEVSAQYTGQQFGPFGMSLSDIVGAIRLLIEL
jgi:hypothetical protein